jgi:hypothetical protein
VNARLTTRAQKLVVGTGATIVAGVVAAVVIHVSLAWRHDRANANLTGTVFLPVDENTCRRLVIDHRTATVTSDERVPCGNQAKEQARAQKDTPRGGKGPAQAQDASDPSRYSSGARLEAVRNSFINR